MNLSSSWVHESGQGETSDWTELWGRCIYEASYCDYLICYFEDGETHSGLFVELGCALAHGRQVYAVGMPKEYKISRYALINHYDDMEAALNQIALDWSARRDPDLDPQTHFTLGVSVRNDQLPPQTITQRLISFAERSLKEELIATGLNYKLAEVNDRRSELGKEYELMQSNLIALAAGALPTEFR